MDKHIYAFKNYSINNSSSGAAFPTIEKVLRGKFKNLIVYGAAFDKNMNVCHQRATCEEDTIAFRGSKYIESNILGINKLIIKDLVDENNIVLFTGTPCQIAGIKRYTQSNNVSMKNLYLLDILCHGTPSQKCWDEYKKWLEKRHKSKLVDYSFRSNGKILIKAKFENGKEIKDTTDLKLFFDLFNSPKMLQERCFKCPFTKMRNEADITIGDFWGVDKVMPNLKVKEGISLVIVNNSKGQLIMQEILQISSVRDDIYLEKCHNKDFIKYNPPLRHPTPRNKQRDKFIKDSKKGWNYLYLKFYIRTFLVKIKRLITS